MNRILPENSKYARNILLKNLFAFYFALNYYFQHEARQWSYGSPHSRRPGSKRDKTDPVLIGCQAANAGASKTD